VDDVVLAGDIDVGDVIVLPGAEEAVLVRRVRFGQGRLILTVALTSGESSEQEQAVKMTTEVRVRKRGRDML